MDREETREPGQIIYHYNREERLASLSPEIRNRKKTRWLRGNRGMIILLIDVLFLVFFFSIIRPLLAPAPDSLTGFGLEFEVKEERSRIFLTISVTALKELTEEKTLKLLVLHGGGQSVLTDLLPMEKDEERVLYASFNRVEEVTTIEIVATIGEEKLRKILSLEEK